MNKEQLSMPRCDIEDLKSQIKHLKDLQTNQDKEVDRLRELLKKCKTHLENSKSALWNFPETEILLTRINAAIGESEE